MFLSSFLFQSKKEIIHWLQDRNFIVVTICFHFCLLVISIFPCIHCCNSLTDLLSNISITASDVIEQLRDSNAKLNRRWIFANITKRFSFFNLHNHSRSFISNDIHVMLSNNYNVASYKDWVQTTYIIIYLFLRKILKISSRCKLNIHILSHGKLLTKDGNIFVILCNKYHVALFLSWFDYVI